jgi:Family of unknown function (DUF6364)
MEMQNVTLRLPTDLLKRARHLAVEKDTSLSKLILSYIESMLRQENENYNSKQQFAKALRRGADLGTKGERSWTRDELHER